MFKMIGRIVLILLAAGILFGGLYLYANNAGASLANLPGGDFGEMRSRPQFDSGSSVMGAQGSLPARPEGGFRGEGQMDREGGSLFAFTGVLVNLAKVAGITLLVVLVQRIYAAIRRRPTPAPAAN